MSANPIEENSTPKPTGSLEDLFRHHLGEEAAVPPRPMLWDQIDNSLLVRQNETYRRRLAATRWVAAASLLLATLAGTGWWAHRAGDMANPEVATATRATTPNDSTSARFGRPANSPGGSSPASDALVAASGSTSLNPSLSDADAMRRNAAAGSSTAASGVAANSARRSTGFGPASTGQNLATSRDANSAANGLGAGNTNTTSAASTKTSLAANQSLAARSTQTATTDDTVLNSAATGENVAMAATPAATGAAVASGTTTTGAAATATPGAASFAQAASTVAPEQVSLLAANSAALSLPEAAALPNGLTSLSIAEIEPVLAAQKWHYGGSYTVGAFNPNINFSRTGIEPQHDYNPALGADSPALTEAAAAQYRENLRPGLSHRIALVAKRHLAGHWSLSTGAEFTQATAKSASSSAFIGEQLIDLGQFTNGAMRTTDFRYRMAGIPVELSYSNPAKRGWSIYGRIGGVVSALLGVRSEVDGLPEATRTYSLASTGMPYRRLLGSVRGAAGAQYRTGNWGFMLGPTAELGLVPLNAHPVQSFMAQSRPYSFGLEAGVEFGR
ncbi:hypothetical protein [Hymenobacter arizonensis]|uniref:Outer membrane protein beta-barrel domain-containing protein n=1 Tax=Hymenobacter arizonensis TaxID=1227077 RepID=A0A1I5WTD2_HYMAR|nr:hypothetical protein [Hymenobacter arizonensis]SFQ22757.1 hypothetical protein SAMN04515668_1471 [Hymenobacter arizonensis]